MKYLVAIFLVIALVISFRSIDAPQVSAQLFCGASGTDSRPNRQDPNGSPCSEHDTCNSRICYLGTCIGRPNTCGCNENGKCASNYCQSPSNGGTCQNAPVPPTPTPIPPPPYPTPPPARINCTLPDTDVILVIDRSLSMSGGKMGQAIQAASSFVSLVGDLNYKLMNVRIGAVTFDDNANVIWPLWAGTDYAGLENRLLALQHNNTVGTCLECALDDPRNDNDALGQFKNNPAGTKKIIIILTDGNINRYVDGSNQIVGGDDPKARQHAQQAAYRLFSTFSNSPQFFVAHYGNGSHAADMQYFAYSLVSAYYGPGKYRLESSTDTLGAIYKAYAGAVRGGYIYTNVYADGNLVNGWNVTLSCTGGSRTPKQTSTAWVSPYNSGWVGFVSIPTGSDYNLTVSPLAGYVPLPPSTNPKTGMNVTAGILTPSGVCTAGAGDECDFTDFKFQKLGSISGCVFYDLDNDGVRSAGETFTGTPSISLSGYTFDGTSFTTRTSNNVCYTFPNLHYGSYILRYTNPPAGWTVTSPIGLGNYYSMYYNLVTCTISPVANGIPTCTKGDVTNANFGVTNIVPWEQAAELNVREDSGYDKLIPPAPVCPKYAIQNGSTGATGILFSGNSAPYFGTSGGTADSRNWKVYGANSLYSPSGSSLKTSYASMLDTLQRNKQTTSTLPCPASGCTLSSTIPSNAYLVSGNLTINSGSISGASRRRIVIIVGGNLQINGPIQVGSGSFLMFVVRGDISVASSVGRVLGSYSCPGGTTQLDGMFSTDSNFIVNGINGTICPAATDRQLNIGGSIVTNAALTPNGTFTNNRTLCGSNQRYPAVSIQPRLDFVLNAPDYITRANTIWQEVAP